MLQLKAAPTFKAPVTIRAPGGEEHIVMFEFKHRTATELEAWLTSDTWKEQGDVLNVLSIAVGWSGVEGEFGEQSLRTLFENYHGSAAPIVNKYLSELTAARLGN